MRHIIGGKIPLRLCVAISTRPLSFCYAGTLLLSRDQFKEIVISVPNTKLGTEGKTGTLTLIRQTDRQTERQTTDKKTNRQTDRQTDTQTNKTYRPTALQPFFIFPPPAIRRRRPQ